MVLIPTPFLLIAKLARIFHELLSRDHEDGYRSQASKKSSHIRQSPGVMEWWRIAKYQIPSTKSQGVRCQMSFRYQVSGFRCQVREKKAES
jgi:hypothetical protein